MRKDKDSRKNMEKLGDKNHGVEATKHGGDLLKREGNNGGLKKKLP